MKIKECCPLNTLRKLLRTIIEFWFFVIVVLITFGCYIIKNNDDAFLLDQHQPVKLVVNEKHYALIPIFVFGIDATTFIPTGRNVVFVLFEEICRHDDGAKNNIGYNFRITQNHDGQSRIPGWHCKLPHNIEVIALHPLYHVNFLPQKVLTNLASSSPSSCCCCYTLMHCFAVLLLIACLWSHLHCSRPSHILLIAILMSTSWRKAWYSCVLTFTCKVYVAPVNSNSREFNSRILIWRTGEGRSSAASFWFSISTTILEMQLLCWDCLICTVPLHKCCSIDVVTSNSAFSILVNRLLPCTQPFMVSY